MRVRPRAPRCMMPCERRAPPIPPCSTSPSLPLGHAAFIVAGLLLYVMVTRIASPRDGSVYAFDPDMPPAAQRITFEGQAGTWVLDGKRLGRGATWRWAPRPGRHALRLLGRDGSEVQQVTFEVRGTGQRDARAAKR